MPSEQEKDPRAIGPWLDREDYDDWANDLLVNAPDSYDDDVAMEAIITRYVHDLETAVKWLLDHSAVGLPDGEPKISWPLHGWTTAPPELGRIFRGYVDGSHA